MHHKKPVEIRKTVCNRDCPDAFGIVATVEDGRVVRLQGDPDHPVTRGFLCFRTSHFLSTQYAEDRLTRPLLRRGGKGAPLEEVGRALLEATDPPIRAVWITAGNPVAMLPESEATREALARTELVIVADSFLTDTAELADLVLPTTTLVESDDLLGAYGHHYLGASRPVVPPPDGVKSDLEILQGLARSAHSGCAPSPTIRSSAESTPTRRRASPTAPSPASSPSSRP